MSQASDSHKPPKVLISYSHDSTEHSDRVLALSDRLREDGVDCEIDQYVANPSSGWPNWMLDRIDEADFVLVVCTDTYHRRFRQQEPGRAGKGATWEGAVINQELYDAKGQNDKFIPVVCASGDAKHRPVTLRGVNYYEPLTDDGYERLYRRLTNQHDTEKPGLGKLQRLAPRRRQTLRDRVTDGGELPASSSKRRSALTVVGGIVAIAIVAIVLNQAFWSVEPASEQTSHGETNGSGLVDAPPGAARTGPGAAASSNAKTPNVQEKPRLPAEDLIWNDEGDAISVGGSLWLKATERRRYYDIGGFIQTANGKSGNPDTPWRLPKAGEFEELRSLIIDGAIEHQPGDYIWAPAHNRLSAPAMRYDPAEPVVFETLNQDSLAYVRLVRQTEPD